MTSKKYKVAVIGCGRMGGFIDNEVIGSSIVTLPFSFGAAFETCDRTKIVAGCDTRVEILNHFGTRYGLQSKNLYRDYRKLIEIEQPDIIAIGTQPEQRAEIIIFAAENGVKAIYSEKTMTASMTELENVVDAAEQNNVVVNMGCGYRWHPGFQKVKEIVDSGYLGDLKYMVMSYRNGINQHGIHALDLANFINGDVETSWVQGSVLENTLSLEGDLIRKDPDMIGTVHYKNGVNVTLLVTPFTDAQEFVCDKGQILVYRGTSYYKGFYNWEIRKLQDNGELLVDSFPEFKPYSTTLWVIEDLVNTLDTGKITRGGIKVARAGDEQTFSLIESHIRGGIRVNLPLEDSKIRLERNLKPRMPLFEPSDANINQE